MAKLTKGQFHLPDNLKKKGQQREKTILLTKNYKFLEKYGSKRVGKIKVERKVRKVEKGDSLHAID